MKILLLGEFSGLHKNLQIGLRGAGHHVDLVSMGDGFKSIYGNIIPPLPKGYHLWDKLKFRWDYYNFIKKLSGYDVVQIINVTTLIHNWFPSARVLQYLKMNNGKVFLLATGSDAFYWQKARYSLRYGPFEDTLKYDLKKTSSPFQSRRSLEFNHYIAENVDGIIPTAYEYALGYNQFPNVKKTIPLPISVESIKYSKNYINKKVIVFHGLSRYGFKGTRHIEEAFNLLNMSAGNKVSFKIRDGLPLGEYLSILSDSNIVIDQVNSYSYGMNAVYAAAMGKTVLSGAEPECLNELEVVNCPIINVRPDANEIQEKILNLLSTQDSLSDLADVNREYVKRVHCCHKISQKYIKSWT